MTALIVFLSLMAYLLGVCAAWFLVAYFNDTYREEHKLTIAVLPLSWLVVLFVGWDIVVIKLKKYQYPTLKKDDQ